MLGQRVCLKIQFCPLPRWAVHTVLADHDEGRATIAK
jgi:hypothetical protein